LPGAVFPESSEPLSVDGCLEMLRRGWNSHLKRYEMGEIKYMEAYREFLAGIVKTRIDYVHEWLVVNTSRFTDNPDIAIVLQHYEELTKELQMFTIPCGAICSNCGLFCLDQRLHDGPHDCKTNHKCATLCEFAEQHEGNSIPSCDIP
jgi:hypothetical protein